MKTNGVATFLCICAPIVFSAGCAHRADYLVHFRSQAPYRPRDGSELIGELEKSLSAEVVTEHSFFNRRKDEMRGSMLVSGKRGRGAVLKALRANPKLAPVVVEKAHAGGKFLVCFSSSEGFKPSDEAQLLTEFRVHVPATVRPKVLMTRRKGHRIVCWVLVKGNLGKASAKFAVRHNPNLSLLQVEQWSLPLRLGFWLRRRQSSSPRGRRIAQGLRNA